MPRITIRPDKYLEVYSAIARTPESRNKLIELKIAARKRPIRKNDLLHIYWRNIYTRKFEKIGILRCKKADEVSGKFQTITLLTTYDRKYYLNRQVKKAGFKLELEQTSKTILVPPQMANDAADNQALKELGKAYNYGIQYTIL
jgi:hypothetical protein